MLALINDFLVTTIYANASDDIVNALKAFVGPILLLILGLVSITFLFRRQVAQFLVFLGIALVVLIVFYAPDFLTSIAQSVQGETGQGSWGK